MISFQEAKDLLLVHSFRHPDINHPKMETGFLGSLRPYQGLREENYHEVMQAIIAISSHLKNSSSVDKDIISALWSICDLTRTWGIEPNGMLRRNNLIMPMDLKKLSYWLHTISYAVFVLLDDGDLETALEPYRHYAEQTWEA